MIFTEEDLKKVKDYICKKDEDIKDGHCKLGYVINGELKFFDITIEKEKQ